MLPRTNESGKQRYHEDNNKFNNKFQFNPSLFVCAYSLPEISPQEVVQNEES